MNKIQYIAFILFILVLIVVLQKYYDSKENALRGSQQSSFSPAEYATYPRETGNPVADIAILNQAGFRYDH